MNPKEARKSFVSVLVTIVVAIGLLFMLFSASPSKEAVAGHAFSAGGINQPAGNTDCSAVTGFPLFIESPLSFAVTPRRAEPASGSYPRRGCCPTRYQNGCRSSTGCVNQGDFYQDGSQTRSDFLCSSNHYVLCTDRDAQSNGYIVDNHICIVEPSNCGNNGPSAGRCHWQPKSSCSPVGKSLSGRAYCSAQGWVALGSGCNLVESYSALPDGSDQTNERSACCPANSCSYTGATAGTEACYTQGNMVAGDSLICATGNWMRCDSSTSATGKGAIITVAGGNKICRNNAWAAATCTSQEEGTAYGQAYCTTNLWKKCSELGLACETVGGQDRAYSCDTLRANSVTPSGQYYCDASGSEWTKCKRDVLGQIKADSFVCTQSGSSFQWTQVNCQACAGSNAGKCVGSGFINVETGQPRSEQDNYYTGAGDFSPQRQIGCVSEAVKQCYYGGVSINEDEGFPRGSTAPSSVCGKDNKWLTCLNTAVGLVASDGGKWLCDAGTWLECDPTVAATPATAERGNYVCTNVAGKWQWFSEFACSATQNYRRKDSGQKICLDGSWRDCTYLDNNPIQDNNIAWECTSGGARTVNVQEAACTNNEDDDNDGFSDCQDTDCYGTLSASTRYGVNLQRQGCLTATVSDGTLTFRNINLCDTGTERIANRATLCYDGGGPTVVQSIFTLRNANSAPLQTGRLTFLYKEPESGSQKEVDVFLTEDISDGNGHEFELPTFLRSMVSEQGLVLVADGQYYLLNYEQSNGTLFSLDNLKITHVPGGSIHQAQLYAGSNSYIFNVLAQKSILVAIGGDRGDIVNITLGEPFEAAAAYVTPENLERDFEVSFTQQTPVDIVTPDVGVLTVCRQDNPADLGQARVCLQDTPQGAFTEIAALKRSFLTKLRIGGADYAFLYEIKDGKKTVSVFSLTVLSSTTTNMPYNQLINALIAGKRIAYEFSNKLYLAEHPVQQTLSLTGMKLVSYEVAGSTDFVASGSDDRVEFLVPDGRITIQRNYAAPPPPFEVTALTKQQIVDVPTDLDTEFFTSMSSEIPTKIVAPTNYGIISADASDIALFQQTFRLSALNLPGEVIALEYQVPLPRGDTLFYYHSAAVTGATPIKTVSVYRLFQLTEQDPRAEHPFNNNFITTFTSGKEIAVRFENSYYRLGYQGESQGAQFFDLSKLVLTTLNGGTTFPVSVVGSVAKFTVPEGDLTIKTDRVSGNDVIVFSRQSQQTIATEEFTRDFSFVLTPSNSISLNRRSFRMCNAELYAARVAANICYGNEEIIIGTPIGISVGNDQYLLELNGQIGNQKRLTIRKIIRLNERSRVFGPFNWSKFTEQIRADDIPIFNLSGTLYFPNTQDSSLAGFGLVPYPQGTIIGVQEITEISPILENGSIVIGEDMITITEQLSGATSSRTIDGVFTLRDFDYLPDNGDKVKLNISSSGLHPFVTSVIGDVYPLEVVRTGNFVIRLRLPGYFDRNFATGSSRILTLGGQSVEISVDNVYSGNDDATTRVFRHADITIKRK